VQFGQGRGGTFGAAAAVALTSGLLVGVVVLQELTPAPASARLTVFEGKAEAGDAGFASFHQVRSGDSLTQGAVLRTAAQTKASVTYPNSSQVRLDSNTQLHLNSVTRALDGTMKIDAFQSIGKTWSSLSQLATGSSYTIHAPNSTTAEVRGTEFEVIVEIVGGVTVVRINVFAGIVAVTADGVTVVLTAGESTTITSAAPPTPAQPISTGDRVDSFTVFNQTLDSSQGVPIAADGGYFTPPQSTGLLDGPTGDGVSDLQFNLGWPGSKFGLAVFAPDGTLSQRLQSASPPVAITAYRAATGVWKYQVTDLESRPGEAWWVIISRITPSQLGSGVAQGPPAGASSSPPPTGASIFPASSIQGLPHSTPGAQPSPWPSPSSAPSPSPSPNPVPPNPTPSPSPPPPPPPPPAPSPGAAYVRGDGSIATGPAAASAECASSPGAPVRFSLRTSHTPDKGAADAAGSASIGFATADSCTPSVAGPRTYELGSRTLRNIHVSISGGARTVVMTFSNLTITDETTSGKHGAIVVECSRFTLQVTVVPGSGGPHSGQIGFEVRDGDGKLVWSSGLRPLVTGSLSAA
jgi:hypothetical protein